MLIPSGSTAGRPTNSATMSAPRPPVSPITFETRSIGVGARGVGGVIGDGRRRVLDLAGRELAAQALVAAAAGKEVRVDDAVALLQRLPLRGRGEVRAQLVDAARHLVPPGGRARPHHCDAG